MIVNPNDLNAQALTRNQPVTKGELEKTLLAFERDFNALVQRLEFLEARQDTFIRGWKSVVKDAGPFGVMLDTEAYRRIMTKLLTEFNPALIRILKSATILERCAKAKEWNSQNADLVMSLDDLDLMLLIPWTTDSDVASMQGIPASAAFWQAWTERGGKTDEPSN